MGRRGSEFPDGDVFWNHSQQDLLMDGTWGMHKGESCHARLQVSGLSTWVDGGAFFQNRRMTGGGADVGGKYQDFAPETRSPPRKESNVEGGGRVA